MKKSKQMSRFRIKILIKCNNLNSKAPNYNNYQTNCMKLNKNLTPLTPSSNKTNKQSTHWQPNKTICLKKLIRKKVNSIQLRKMLKNITKLLPTSIVNPLYQKLKSTNSGSNRKSSHQPINFISSNNFYLEKISSQ